MCNLPSYTHRQFSQENKNNYKKLLSLKAWQDVYTATRDGLAYNTFV